MSYHPKNHLDKILYIQNNPTIHLEFEKGHFLEKIQLILSIQDLLASITQPISLQIRYSFFVILKLFLTGSVSGLF